MSALAALKRMEHVQLEFRERSRTEGESFHHEMDHAKRAAPPKKQAPKKQDDPDAPPPDAQAQKAQPQDDKAENTAVAVAVTGAAKTGGVDAMMAQSVADAAKQVAATAAGDVAPTAQIAMTPLEQAVHDLIDQIRGGTDADQRVTEISHAEPIAAAPVSIAPIDERPSEAPAALAQLPEPQAEQAQPANPSHVHLVIDEAQRLVVTVAVRGNDVVAHIRGGDESTASALARNAGSLDDAMRARGLNLAELTSQRDESQPDRQDRQQRERDKQQPTFTLENIP